VDVLSVDVSHGGASQRSGKPNILVIFGDDVGYWNVSAYNRGMAGYRTPNIDRLAKEGAIFTDYYGQQSCTAGRAAFITGQSPIRTGLLAVGLPGSPIGLQKQDPTIADLLKPLGYMTFQNGKNHLGDRNEFMPTVHGFDEFFGNLYHLNAEQEPENVDYPVGPDFAAKFTLPGGSKLSITPSQPIWWPFPKTASPSRMSPIQTESCGERTGIEATAFNSPVHPCSRDLSSGHQMVASLPSWRNLRRALAHGSYPPAAAALSGFFPRTAGRRQIRTGRRTGAKLSLPPACSGDARATYASSIWPVIRSPPFRAQQACLRPAGLPMVNLSLGHS
jgi:hypothetical protein